MLDVARLVNPILKKRQWSVLQLSELERNDQADGRCYDGGKRESLQEVSKISLNIRQSRDQHNNDQFRCPDDLIEMMHHEMAHIKQFNHELAFYELLNELRAEFMALHPQSSYRHEGSRALHVSLMGSKASLFLQ